MAQSDDDLRRRHELEIYKGHFVAALRKIPSGPARVRDRQLRKLAYRYKDLKEFNDEIPYSLQRFGLPDRMTFDDFIWQLVG